MTIHAKLLAACQALAEYSDQTLNCSVCARGHDEHADDCPVPGALAAVELAERGADAVAGLIRAAGNILAHARAPGNGSVVRLDVAWLDDLRTALALIEENEVPS